MDNQTVHSVIVGGTRGMGRALVAHLAKKGHTVSVIGGHAPSQSDADLGIARYWKANLEKPNTFAKIVEQIVRHNGRITNLVFFQRYRGSGDSWTGEIATTLTATKTLIDLARTKFEARGGSIVAVSSLAGKYIAKEQPLSYHVGKAGLNQLITYYAVALGPHGIRVNSVSPGTVIKEESREFYESHPSILALYKKITPLGRLATSQDVAQAISYLCDARSSFITGQNLVVDGGLSLVLQDALARSLSSPGKKRR